MTAFFLAALLLSATPEAEHDNARRYEMNVVSCYDGDTCTVDFQWSTNIGMGIVTGAVLAGQKLRFCDIDTPEMRGKDLTPEQRSHAKFVRDRLLQWLKDAKRLWVEIPQRKGCDPQLFTNCDRKGKYGRWLAWVYADGVLLNERLVDEGLADENDLKCD